jgi:phosphoglycerate dehydrogenase-like enzyme
MHDPFGRTAAEPLVVAVTTPFPPDDSLHRLLVEHVADVEVHFTPYNESRDARAARGANNGVLPAGIEVPDVNDATKAIWARAHVFVGLDLPSESETLSPDLQWLQTISAGVDQIDQQQLARMRARLSSASGVASASIAEFVMARLLGVWKNLRPIEQHQREETWVEDFGTEVTGRTMVIAGLGSIGREVARRARAFDMHVIATRGSAQPGDSDPDVDELHPASELASLLPKADAVVCALPSSPATSDLFDAAMFRTMKADAIFCNVGRGTLVVEDDLVQVLNEGHLRAAVLDVMRTEPLLEGDPLWSAPRLYLSPHAAVSLDRYKENAWAIVADNLRRFMAGERLHNEIDLPSSTA